LAISLYYQVEYHKEIDCANNNQPIRFTAVLWLYVLFPSQAVITAAFDEKLMPRDTKSGKFVLESVRREQVAAQAARTDRAVARCTAAPDQNPLELELRDRAAFTAARAGDAVDLTRESSSGHQAPGSERPRKRPSLRPVDPDREPGFLDRANDPGGNDGPWDRHIFSGGRLVIFSRGRDESITLRKNPDGHGWFINLEEQEPIRPTILPE
jgi:hypothetical protein